MKDSEYDCRFEGKSICFYHNQTTHRYEIIIDFDCTKPYVVTKAKGVALIKFLKHVLKLLDVKAQILG